MRILIVSVALAIVAAAWACGSAYPTPTTPTPGGTGGGGQTAGSTDGGNYHCTIHPTMVGSIKSSSGTVPPCSGVYCDSSR